MNYAPALILSALVFGIAPNAFSQDEKTDNPTYIDVGATVLIRPSYVGSKQIETSLVPYIGLDNFYGINLIGPNLTAEFIDIGTGKGPGKWSLSAGPRVTVDFGRDSDDSPTLEGLDDVDTSLMVGGYVRSTLSVIGFDLSAGQDVIDGHNGFVADASIGTRYPGDGWYIQPIVTLSWADENYTQAVYGITSTQAQSSALGLFETSSGFHQASATVISGFEINDNWNATAVLSYREALGDYRNSPILQAVDGKASGFFTALSISRRFKL